MKKSTFCIILVAISIIFAACKIITEITGLILGCSSLVAGAWYERKEKRNQFKAFSPVLVENSENAHMWVARDIDDELYLYEEKPIPYEGFYGYAPRTQLMQLDKDLFPELSYEDGPKQVKLVLTE